MVATAAAGVLATGCSLPLLNLDPDDTVTAEAASAESPSTPAGTGEPTGGSSTPPLPCPDTGIRITSGGVDAAMGRRWLAVIATNCGKADVDLSGYPEATVTGESTAVVASPGGDQATDPGVTPILLAPGDEACAVLTWRLLVESGETVSAEEFDLAPQPGLPAQVMPDLVDLGTTGVWHTTAWFQGTLPEMSGPCGTVPS